MQGMILGGKALVQMLLSDSAHATTVPARFMSEQGHKPGGLEMAAVREGFRDAEPAHDDEGNVIDDSGRADQPASVIGPGLIDVTRRPVAAGQ
jgi:hypothetical protein